MLCKALVQELFSALIRTPGGALQAGVFKVSRTPALNPCPLTPMLGEVFPASYETLASKLCRGRATFHRLHVLPHNRKSSI